MDGTLFPGTGVRGQLNRPDGLIVFFEQPCGPVGLPRSIAGLGEFQVRFDLEEGDYGLGVHDERSRRINSACVMTFDFPAR